MGQKGDKVNAFRGANDAIGTLVLRFENEEDLEKVNNQSVFMAENHSKIEL